MAVPTAFVETGILGTWVIAISAIWGERIRAALFKPRLRIDLVSASGEVTDQTLTWVDPKTGELATRTRRARYYHLRVSNPPRFPIAHSTQLVIVAIEVPGPDGTPQLVYQGPMPLPWRHSNMYPTIREVGPPAVADLLAVNADGELGLTPLIIVNNFPQKQTGPSRMWVTVVAESTERDSAPVRIAISWNGKWDPGEAEMQKNLKIELPAPL